MGHRVPLRRLLAIGLSGDAASAITPCRIGGDVARTVGLERSGVPRWRAAAAVVVDSIQTWPIVFAGGAVLACFYGGAWWAAFSAGMAAFARRLDAPVVAAAIGAAAIFAWIAVRLLRRARRTDEASPTVPRLRFSTGRLLVTLPLTLVATAARVAILPVLAAAVVGTPPAGQTALGSLAFLQAQSFLPLPAGAGVVDAGFVSAWTASASAARVLFQWRVYTSGLAALLGAGVLLKTAARRLRLTGLLPGG